MNLNKRSTATRRKSPSKGTRTGPIMLASDRTYLVMPGPAEYFGTRGLSMYAASSQRPRSDCVPCKVLSASTMLASMRPRGSSLSSGLGNA